MKNDLQTFLDSGTSFEGKISFTGAVRIDGHFRGTANADGMLIVGETGTIDAKLEVRELLVLGSVVGEVTAKERVEVGPQGRLDGVVRAPRIKIVDGAQVSARIEMGEPGRTRS
ncbi:MAG TPA: polymer-forming cytoskeletal protein [Myxococcota bacterium]|nr:polymer-forming cytoskeletal protein [Myxococcota bacterium]